MLERDERLDKLLGMPLAELKGLAETPEGGMVRATNMSDLEYAARRRTVDWDLWDRIRDEGAHMLLPELQGYRQMGKWLALRARFQIAAGDYTGAARSLETCLCLGHDLAEGPTLIHNLVGIAVATQAVNQLEEWVRTPGSPNLYWAMTNLPAPLIDLRAGFGGERLFIEGLFPGIRERVANPAVPPLSTAQCRAMYDEFNKLLEQPNERQEFSKVIDKELQVAKKFLSERGWTNAQLDARPAEQLVLMYEIAEYDRNLDENIALIGLPFPARLARVAKLKDKSDAHIVANFLIPATKVHVAPVKLERRLAALKAVEAIRAHAAKTGSLPATLAEVTVLDVPNDPATGKAFDYTKTDAGATLSGPLLATTYDTGAFSFNVTLAK